MAEYVTLIEAAELEGVKYKTMAQRLSRNPDKFDTMTEKLENGGKDAVLVAVASLSKKARNAWKERAKLKELSGTISPEGEAQPEPEAPVFDVTFKEMPAFLHNFFKKTISAVFTCSFLL